MTKPILVTEGRFVKNKSVDSLREYEGGAADDVKGKAGMIGTATKQAKLWVTATNPFSILFTEQESHKVKVSDQYNDAYAVNGKPVDGVVEGDGIANVLVKSGETITYGEALDIETVTGKFIAHVAGIVAAAAMEDSGGALAADTLMKARLFFNRLA